MADQAKVTSLDALELFRAKLIVFINRAQSSVDEVLDEVRRTRLWLLNDQRFHWEREIRRRQKLVEAAKAELMSARLSGLREVTSPQENAVRKAREALAEAEEKLRNVKRWSRDYEHSVEPLTRKIEILRSFLSHDMPKALVYLVQAQRTLEDYAGTRPLKEAGPATTENPPEANETLAP
jgi:hypothetical protein